MTVNGGGLIDADFLPQAVIRPMISTIKIRPEGYYSNQKSMSSAITSM
jgi:hypothetical protein